jgi:hypothetical protein
MKELGYQDTPLGVLSLRKRFIHSLGEEVLEVKLGEDYLMSSLFTRSERYLGRWSVELAARQSTGADPGAGVGAGIGSDSTPGLDVVVGGLGLGCTASEVLRFRGVRSLTVVELFPAVIDWHRKGLIETEPALTEDSRCRLMEADFFELALSEGGFDPDNPGRKYHAIIVDIDHTPDLLLDEKNSRLYTPEGLGRVARFLHPGGVFGLWSDHPPDEEFRRRLECVFGSAEVRNVTFENPFTGEKYTQAVYLAEIL